jgi:hypothetical protein
VTDFITTATSDRYHATPDCPAFRRGVLGNEVQGIPARPIQHLTADQAERARQTRCHECLPTEHGAL